MSRPDLDDGPFSDGYRQALARLAGVGEPRSAAYPPAPPGVGEKLVRCLWFDQFLDPDALRTEDGRRLAVVSPGHWNAGAGPDFRNAEIRFDDGEVIRGDVEAHLLASDYARHGHGGDPSYDGVILHVVFSNDLGQAFLDTVGRRVPQLALDRLLTDDLAEVLEALDLDLPAGESPSRSGPCGEALARRGRDAAWMGRFLDLAGDARALSRAETWADALTRSTPDQCLYEGAMDALGFKGNRRPFRGLAERVTLERLRRLAPVDGDLAGRRRVIEAVLFNVAGLTPTEAEARDWDDASREYVTSLAEAWIPVASEFGQTRLARGMWQFGRTRPVNYPTRRIAAAAALLARHAHTGLFRAVVEALERAGSEATPAARARAARRGIEALFLLEGEGYWSRRCVFGGRPMARPARLLGPDRALGMVVNVIVPLVLACARGHQDAPLERLLHGVYASLGRMPDDSVTRYMGSRLFQDVETARRVAATARRQQGLFQLYHDFCEGRQTVCERCRFLALVSGEETAPC